MLRKRCGEGVCPGCADPAWPKPAYYTVFSTCLFGDQVRPPGPGRTFCRLPDRGRGPAHALPGCLSLGCGSLTSKIDQKGRIYDSNPFEQPDFLRAHGGDAPPGPVPSGRATRWRRYARSTAPTPSPMPAGGSAPIVGRPPPPWATTGHPSPSASSSATPGTPSRTSGARRSSASCARVTSPANEAPWVKWAVGIPQPETSQQLTGQRHPAPWRWASGETAVAFCPLRAAPPSHRQGHPPRTWPWPSRQGKGTRQDSLDPALPVGHPTGGDGYVPPPDGPSVGNIAPQPRARRLLGALPSGGSGASHQPNQATTTPPELMHEI
jgi:hypothetical protein